MIDEQEQNIDETPAEQPAAEAPASEEVEVEAPAPKSKGKGKAKKPKKKKAEAAPEPETPSAEPVEEGAGSPVAEESSVEEAVPEAEVPAEPVEALAEEPVPPSDAESPVNEEAAVETEVATLEEESTEEGGAEETAEPLETDSNYALPQVVESILFASQKPMSAKELLSVFKGAAEAVKEIPDAPARAFAKIKEAHLREAIEVLENACTSSDRAYEVRESAAGWQLVTKPHYSPWLRQLFPEHRSARLSAPALETLAIIAYRQPITRADIEAVRGVAVDGVMQTLLDRGLIKIAGRADIPGRPLLYDTTQNFMEHFGLKNLDDLPNAAELRKISLPTAEPPPAETPANPEAPVAPAGEASATPASAEAAPENASEPPAETPVEESAGTAAETTAEEAAETVAEEPGEAAEEPAETPAIESEPAPVAEEPTVESSEPEVEISPEPSEEEGRTEH